MLLRASGRATPPTATLNGLFGLGVDHDQLAYKPGVRLTKYVETLTTSQGDLP